MLTYKAYNCLCIRSREMEKINQIFVYEVFEGKDGEKYTFEAYFDKA